jgi:hypothetical protein
VAGIKALYSDARKRAAVAAGIGAYLYTSLEAVVLPIGPHPRQVQAIRRQGKSDLLVLSAETKQWLRNGYATRMSTAAVRRDLGEILAHGEPENGIGQGEVADQAAQLAARISIPRRLPPRYDWQLLAHLSHTSYARWVVCRESWRRYYICGERSAPTGSMFLGRQVDEAITLYYRRILETGDRLTADQVKDAFWDGWKAAAEAEREQLGIACVAAQRSCVCER